MAIVNNARVQSRYNEFSADKQNQIDSYILQGLYGGLNEPKITTGEAPKMVQMDYDLKAAQLANAYRSGGGGGGGGRGRSGGGSSSGDYMGGDSYDLSSSMSRGETVDYDMKISGDQARLLGWKVNGNADRSNNFGARVHAVKDTKGVKVTIKPIGPAAVPGNTARVVRSNNPYDFTVAHNGVRTRL
jgi:hypothetical protein